MGVPLFFVISGFVIARSSSGRTVSEFARARVARIYPTFLVCMSITFITAELFGKPQIEVSIGQWFANWIIAAPLLKSTYVDSVYWSIVYELTFYALIALLMRFGLSERRLPDAVAVWMLISCANEFWINSELLRRILITNYSAFFASGILIYSGLFGRRGPKALVLLVCAVSLGALQADTNSDWLRERGVELSHLIVIALALSAPIVVTFFVCIRRTPLSRGVLLATGGLTYPLYLLHQTIGYIVFNHVAGHDHPLLLVTATAVAMIALSWAFYELVDNPLHTWMRATLARSPADQIPRKASFIP